LFGIQPDRDLTGADTLYPLFRGEIATLEGIARRTYWNGLELVPANLELYQAEYEVPVRRVREGSWHFWRVLDDALAAVADRYDVVVCDCPPSLGYLSMNGIMAATSIIVPVPPAMIDFASTGCFFQMMSEMMEVIGGSEGVTKSFDFVRILTSRFDTADQNHKQVARWMALTYGEWLMENRMILTTALDAAGTRKATYYEAGFSSGSRTTYLRGLDCFDAVNREIEDLIVGVWGREKSQREGI
jgi:chromosome partitioning protein